MAFWELVGREAVGEMTRDPGDERMSDAIRRWRTSPKAWQHRVMHLAAGEQWVRIHCRSLSVHASGSVATLPVV